MRKSASHLARQCALLTSLAIALLAPAPPARAHFVLKSPTAWATQNALGDPQKSAPCGQADPGAPATATGVVTAFRPGETLTVVIDETVFHPGHYRVLLATNRSELPADPQVTAGDTPCGSTVVDATPSYPLLVDGALKHTAPFSGPQSIAVTLPRDVTCQNCTLQVVEFMSDHGLNNPGGCFYHHCADISILPEGGQNAGSGGASVGGASQGGASVLGGMASAGQAGAGTASGGAGGQGGLGVGGTGGQGGLGAGGRVAPGAGGSVEGGRPGFGGGVTEHPPNESGCSCRTPRARSLSFFELALGLSAFGAWRARRR